ncbi:TRL-like family protein [Leptospira langatensis]|uniref:TRL-like family protein n=1 Tax=Leptospira langatensis TaxID=2484983 RepID=A0A5F1ZVZ7_9LEPT|nr:TRL domain-containing protein [Leptospira langatensis]TGJ98207.1 TRL-like family protein [Leptospira langatensis]TGL43121.1 TRL-like family protein [Leptospira langatensis]
MKKSLMAIALIGMLTLTNCIPFVYGSIYTDVTENATIFNRDNSQKDGVGEKSGEACASSILNLIATGDAGIKAAAKKGGMKVVKAIDHNRSNVLGSVYVSSCTIAYGD